MSSTDFAAAQRAVLERRQARAAAAAAAAAHSTSASNESQSFLVRHGRSAWEVLRGREGTRPTFRVGQVDAELLDEELLGLLNGQVGDALKLFRSHVRDDWAAEISLLLRAVLFKISIWDHDASYGATLQGLRYTDGRHSGPVTRPPTRWQKALYGLVTVGGRYAWTRWEEGLIDRPSYGLSRLTSALSTAHSVAAMVSFVVFLLNGRYRTLLDRVLRMRLAPPSNQQSRQVNFEYLNRQLVWHAFTEFLLFLLPLMGISRWRRWLSRAWRRVSRGDEGEDPSTGELAFLPERTCAICYGDQSTTEGELLGQSGGLVGSAQTDITNPYQASCGCVYCFVCLATRIESEEGEGWTCLRCGALVGECRPWGGDVLEGSAKGKSVSFGDDGKDTDQGEV